jgi:hypothetical protein
MRLEATLPAIRGVRLFRRGRTAVSRWVRPALDAREPTGLLTGAQLSTLRAFTEVLVAGAPILDEEWEPVRTALVDSARERPGFRGLCVRGCRLLEMLGGGRFTVASIAERTAWVAGARLAIRPVPATELLLVRRRAQHEVRELLVPELVRAYFDAPAGWAIVGYDVPLGECRDPFAYTGRPP